jgi:isocitrate dehydrogenase (NAD+)
MSSLPEIPIKVTLIRGDGIGPEISIAAIQALDATGAPLAWETAVAGQRAFAQYGTALPDSTVASIRRNRFCLKGPLSTSDEGGGKSVGNMLTRGLELFANVRWVRSFAGRKNLRERVVDMVLLWDTSQATNTGETHDSYHPRGPTEADLAVRKPVISERTIRLAFEHAHVAGRKVVTLVHEASTSSVTTRPLLEMSREIARPFPDIVLNTLGMDECALLLAQAPETLDVIVTHNSAGAVLLKSAADLVGGCELIAAATIGENTAIFEALQDAAPKPGRQSARARKLMAGGGFPVT